MQTWLELLERDHLIQAAAARTTLDDVAVNAELRRLGDADLVRAAIELVSARRKASGKLRHADRIVADVAGVEQATGSDVAQHKAQRFAGLGPRRLVDLCCGVGGDAMALAEVADVLLVDRDPNRTWCARYNVQLATERTRPAAAADVAGLHLRHEVFHLDPSRRNERGRRHRWADYQPGPDFIAELLAANPTGATKLGPGVDVDALPAGEVEFISNAGSLVQAVLWTGDLRRDVSRSATLLRDGTAVRTLSGEPTPPPIVAPGRYLFSTDAAVERGGLLGNLCREHDAGMIHPALGLITSDAMLDDAWLTGFELLEVVPWRQRKVRDWLRQHGAGVVEVKTRDKAVDPDHVQRDLRGKGDTSYTVFVLRFDRQVRALITRRLT